MKIISETNLWNFDAWSGGKDTLDRLISEGKCEELEAILEDMYPDGMTDTELNDLLWFEADEIFGWLGMTTDEEAREELEEELEEAREELEELNQNYKDECEDMTEEKAEEHWLLNYMDDAKELEEKIAELEEALENI